MAKWKMMKFIKSKKAQNDVTLLWTIFVILFALGSIIPIINNYFGVSSTQYDVEGTAEKVGTELTDVATNPLTIGDFVASILSMFFWSFNVNLWVNLLILEPMRIIFYILIYRLVRSGAG